MIDRLMENERWPEHYENVILLLCYSMFNHLCESENVHKVVIAFVA